MSYFSDFSDPPDSLTQGWQVPFDPKMNRGTRINMPGINLSPRGTFNLGTNRQPDQDSNVIFDSPFGSNRRTFGTQGNSAFGAAPGWSQNLLSGFGGDNFCPSYSSPASYSSSPVRGGIWTRERNDADREIPIIRSDRTEDQDDSYPSYESGGQYQEDSDVRDIPIQVCRGPSPSPHRRGCHPSPHKQHASRSPNKDDSYHRGGGYNNSYRGRGGGGRGTTTSHGMGRGGGLGGRRTPSPNKTKTTNQGHHYHQPASPKKASASPPPPHYAQPLGHDHQRSHDEAHAGRDRQPESKPNPTPASPKSLSSVREIPIITTQDARRNMQHQHEKHENAAKKSPHAGQQNAWQQQMDDGAEKLAKNLDFNHKGGQKGVHAEEIPIPVERVGNGCGPSKDVNDVKTKGNAANRKTASQVEDHAMDQADTAPPTPVKVSAPPSPTTVVNEITTYLNEDLKPRVDAFQGGPGAKCSKEFLYLDDALTKALIKLDAIDAGGDEGIRKLRRDAVHAVDQCAAQLESKVSTVADRASGTCELQDGGGGEEMEGYATPPTPNEDSNLNQASSSADNNDTNNNAADPK